VVVTRDEAEDGPQRRRLAELGAEVWALPCTATVPAPDPAPLDEAVAALAGFDWLVVTSRRAVEALLERPAWPPVWQGRPRVAAVGEATAGRLREAGLPVDLVGEAGGAALGAALVGRGEVGAGARVLWPRAEGARPELEQALEEAGARVSAPIAYATRPIRPADLDEFVGALAVGRVDAVTFASPSAAGGLAALLPGGDLQGLRGRTIVASIGPTTSAALEAHGAAADVEARPPGAVALAEAVMERLVARARTTSGADR